MTPTVLVIDDRDDLLRFCERSLGASYTFHRVTSAAAAATALSSSGAVGVLLDRDFSQADPAGLLGPLDDVRNEGLHILRWLRREHPDLPVVMVTGVREMRTALEAAELGADFLAWEDVTADSGVLEARLRHALESRSGGRERVVARFREQGIVAESPAFIAALEALHRALPGRAPILLLGETGTGKDSLAWAAHAIAGKPGRACVTVNVASLNPNLIESELFGHARGAFTGADREYVGRLRSAHGGTLFLNEIGELSPEVQVKLLTVLERSEVVPVGDVNSQPAEFRLVSATSRDLRELLANGRFRRDLYHRIAWHTVEIPPLRERREDVPALANAFMRGTEAHRDGLVFGIAREAAEYLAGLPWPGNVRELRGVIEAACSHARHQVTLSDVRDVVRRHEQILTADVPAATIAAVAAPSPGDFDAAFGDLEYRELMAAYYRYLVRKAGGRLSEVAKLAGISRATVYEWRHRFDASPSGGTTTGGE